MRQREDDVPFVSPEFEAGWCPLAEQTVEGSTVRVMHHPDHTEGPVVLALHGLEEFWQAWLPVAERLLGQFRILSVDLPWRAGNDYGWSEEATPSQWLAKVVDMLPVAPDVLLGHSFGSNTTLEYLAKPGAVPVSAVVLTAPIYRSSVTEISWDLLHGSLANFRDILSAGLQVRSEGRKVDPDIFEKMLDMLVARVGPNGFVNLFRLFGHSPLIKLERVTAPTLVIAGQTEQTGTATGPVELASKLPNGRVELLAEYNHFCEVVQADEVAALFADHVWNHLPPHVPDNAADLVVGP
jgi:pimeloyl-ACP methyl ester carboxylesterase